MDEFRVLLNRLADGHPLSEAEAETAFRLIMSGKTSPARIGAFLMALRVRGETIEEITAGARIMRENVIPVNVPANALDTCGTGGDGAGTFNISTAVSFVVAACGVPVAKHGNKALSSRSGSAEVLEVLGVNLAISPEHISACIAHAGIGFMFAPAHHTAMKHVGPTRQEMGTRTIFNLLGPLSNPARAERQIMGVFDARWVEPLAHVLCKLGSRRAWVVHGCDGLDEITTTGTTRVAELKDATVRSFTIEPADAGLPVAKASALKGGDPEENANALRALLEGAGGAYRDIVLFNAAAALMVADRANTLEHGVSMAGEAIDKGHALEVLKKLVAISNRDL